MGEWTKSRLRFIYMTWPRRNHVIHDQKISVNVLIWTSAARITCSVLFVYVGNANSSKDFRWRNHMPSHISLVGRTPLTAQDEQTDRMQSKSQLTVCDPSIAGHLEIRERNEASTKILRNNLWLDSIDWRSEQKHTVRPNNNNNNIRTPNYLLFSISLRWYGQFMPDTPCCQRVGHVSMFFVTGRNRCDSNFDVFCIKHECVCLRICFSSATLRMKSYSNRMPIHQRGTKRKKIIYLPPASSSDSYRKWHHKWSVFISFCRGPGLSSGSSSRRQKYTKGKSKHFSPVNLMETNKPAVIAVAIDIIHFMQQQQMGRKDSVSGTNGKQNKSFGWYRFSLAYENVIHLCWWWNAGLMIYGRRQTDGRNAEVHFIESHRRRRHKKRRREEYSLTWIDSMAHKLLRPSAGHKILTQAVNCNTENIVGHFRCIRNAFHLCRITRSTFTQASSSCVFKGNVWKVIGQYRVILWVERIVMKLVDRCCCRNTKILSIHSFSLHIPWKKMFCDVHAYRTAAIIVVFISAQHIRNVNWNDEFSYNRYTHIRTTSLRINTTFSRFCYFPDFFPFCFVMYRQSMSINVSVAVCGGSLLFSSIESIEDALESSFSISCAVKRRQNAFESRVYFDGTYAVDIQFCQEIFESENDFSLSFKQVAVVAVTAADPLGDDAKDFVQQLPQALPISKPTEPPPTPTETLVKPVPIEGPAKPVPTEGPTAPPQMPTETLVKPEPTKVTATPLPMPTEVPAKPVPTQGPATPPPSPPPTLAETLVIPMLNASSIVPPPAPTGSSAKPVPGTSATSPPTSTDSQTDDHVSFDILVGDNTSGSSTNVTSVHQIISSVLVPQSITSTDADQSTPPSSKSSSILQKVFGPIYRSLQSIAASIRRFMREKFFWEFWSVVNCIRLLHKNIFSSNWMSFLNLGIFIVWSAFDTFCSQRKLLLRMGRLWP